MNQYLTVDKIGSSTAPCRLSHEVELTAYIVAEEGYCLVVRALEEKTTYNLLECTDGTFQPIRRGDLIIGALGERQALKGYSGRIPRRIQVGDVLNVLNMGGILGQCTSDHPDLGPALRVEVLGQCWWMSTAKSGMPACRITLSNRNFRSRIRRRW